MIWWAYHRNTVQAAFTAGDCRDARAVLNGTKDIRLLGKTEAGSLHVQLCLAYYQSVTVCLFLHT